MVLILQGSSSDPKAEMMLKCLRQKNEKYNMRLEEIIVKYKNEVIQEEKEKEEKAKKQSQNKSNLI